ncbi:HCL391Cp [Eremothecium sinecaudum]|uniref:Peroxin-3 n=1 Tax=Eremothecium sinecaudum TaxID=45286 RepID=A0A109UYD0_9SACH|nr:HCL391Cp [Eremothecium sinecaudum]AMD19760.1 HCL391Cp [Eremothecium sinecaudum]
MTRRVLQRNKGKLITSTLLMTIMLTTGIFTLLMFKNWLHNQQQRLKEQHFAKEQIKRRFNQTQKDAVHTVHRLVPVLAAVLSRDADLDAIVHTLKEQKSKKKIAENQLEGSSGSISQDSMSGDSQQVPSKAELWQQLKQESLVHLMVIVYTMCMLLLLTRLKLNILARRQYLGSAIKLAVENESERSQTMNRWASNAWSYAVGLITGKQSSPDSKVNLETDNSKQSSPTEDRAAVVACINEEAFLSLSWWLLNRGWPLAQPLIEKHVRLQFGHLSPRDRLSITDFETLLSHAIHDINAELLAPGPQSPLLQCFLPDSPAAQRLVLEEALDDRTALRILFEDDSVLRQLLRETTACLQSTATLIVLESLVNESFHYIMQQTEQKVSKNARKGPQNGPPEAYPVALYAISVKEVCSDVLRHNATDDYNNEFLQRLDAVPELDDLSASVYSNFGF